MIKNRADQKKLRLREQNSSSEIHNNWEISYGDMITLLLGFFVLFFNIKTENIQLKLLLKNIENSFKTTQVELSKNPRPPSIDFLKQDNKEIKTYPYQQGNKLIVEFPGVSFFEKGQITLSEDGEKALTKFASNVKSVTGLFRYVIRGYTDHNANINDKTQIENLELSAQRSLSAIRHLHKNGLNLQDMRIGGYGETDRTNRKLPESIRKQDRKIVIVIEPLDAAERYPQPEQDVAITRCIDTYLENPIACSKVSDLSLIKTTWSQNPIPSQKRNQRLPASYQKSGLSKWIEQTTIYKYLNDYYEQNDDQENAK